MWRWMRSSVTASMPPWASASVRWLGRRQAASMWVVARTTSSACAMPMVGRRRCSAAKWSASRPPNTLPARSTLPCSRAASVPTTAPKAASPSARGTISESTKYLTKAAGILGTMVVGALIPRYVTFAFADSLVLGASGSTVQSVFDNLLPNVLPLACVFLIYWLFKKKHCNVILVILGVIAIGLAMSFLGWM